jgi:hypothetical protein
MLVSFKITWRRAAVAFFLGIAAMLAWFGYRTNLPENAYSISARFSEVVGPFYEMRPEIERALQTGKISMQDLSGLYIKWDENGSNPNSFFDGVLFGRNGEYMAISSKLGIAVMIKPDLEKKIWHCHIVPKDTICDRLFPKNFGFQNE